MKKTNMPSRALSCALACALAFTMNPITALAEDSSSAIVQEPQEAAVQPERAESVVDEPETEAAPEVQTPEVQTPVMHSAEVPVAVAAANTEDAAEEEGQPEPAASAAPSEQKSDLEIIAGSVALDETPATMLGHNGLNYQVNPDDPETVSLVGWSTAPTGAMVIPAQIQTNTGTLAVTGIVTGGGSLKI